MELETGKIQGIIGPNGAGKTTVFNLITGIYHPDSGKIWLHKADGPVELTNLSSDAIARAGVARTFQNIRLFNQMSVLDNIKIAFNSRTGYRLLDVFIGSFKYQREEENIRRQSLEYLSRFGLADRCDELAKNLPYGEQRRLEIARALATNPKVLLLDEPAAGMNPNRGGGINIPDPESTGGFFALDSFN